MWPEDTDVDLYLKDLATGQWCFYRNASTAFATYLEDIQSQASSDDPRYELIYQQNIKPGNYEVYLHLYSSGGGTANVATYAVIYPYSDRERKITFPSQRIRHTASPPEGGGIRLGSLNLTAESLTN